MNDVFTTIVADEYAYDDFDFGTCLQNIEDIEKNYDDYMDIPFGWDDGVF